MFSLYGCKIDRGTMCNHTQCEPIVCEQCEIYEGMLYGDTLYGDTLYGDTLCGGISEVNLEDLRGLRFELPYEIYQKYMYSDCCDLACTLKCIFGIGQIKGLRRTCRKYIDHFVYKIDNIYIDIRGVFLSDLELLNEPIKTLIYDKTSKRESKFEITNDYKNHEIVDDNNDFGGTIDSEHYDACIREYSIFIINLIMEKYPKLKQHIEQIKSGQLLF